MSSSPTIWPLPNSPPFRLISVMPGSLGLDAMWQMIGYWLGWSGSPGKGRAIGVGEVAFTGSVTPQTRCVRYEVAMRQVRRGKLVLGFADGRVRSHLVERFWGPSELTIREWIGSINTRAFGRADNLRVARYPTAIELCCPPQTALVGLRKFSLRRIRQCPKSSSLRFLVITLRDRWRASQVSLAARR